jgi:hypothetical protein
MTTNNSISLPLSDLMSDEEDTSDDDKEEVDKGEDVNDTDDDPQAL